MTAMFARVTPFVIIPFFFFSITVLSKCQPKPLLLPIEDVALSGGASMRGVALTVGSHPRNISFLINGVRNETYIYGPNGRCPESYSDAACFTYRGGQYDPSKSSTASKTRDRDGSDSVSAEWWRDNLHARLNVSLDGVEIGVLKKDMDQDYKTQAQLGIARNSSILRTMKEAGKIGARAYSLFWSLASGPAERRTAGSLMLGGIDEALTGTGVPNFTSRLSYDFTCSTGMLVAINDISLNWPNGTDTSLFMGERATIMQACIQPDFPGLMSMPVKYWENFLNLAGGEYPGGVESRTKGINFWTMLFEPEGVFYGDMTISFQNSISVRIPNTQLVVEDRYIDPSSGKVLTNQTVRNLAINPIQEINENGLPNLGRLFLTSAYLSVNHDTETFSLWGAIQTPGEPKPRALDSNTAVISEFCSEDSTSTTPSPIASAEPPPQQQTSKKEIAGALIGGIVAGVVALIAIVSLLAFFLRRRRRRNVSEIDRLRAPTPRYDSRPEILEIPSEMPAGKLARRLQGHNHHLGVHELDGREYGR